MGGAKMAGVVAFPAEYAARYRAAGYWRDEPMRDEPMRDEFARWCAAFADRVALRDAEREVSYAQLDARSTNLALNLLDLGIAPRDRVLVQLPNVIEFVYLHFALQKIGAIPVMALPPHRYREMSFFAEVSQAVAAFTPSAHRDFSYVNMIERIREATPQLVHHVVLGDGPPGTPALQADWLPSFAPTCCQAANRKTA